MSRASLDKLNETWAQKTNFDDDATATGQSVLAQFQPTGKQITDLDAADAGLRRADGQGSADRG